MQTYELSMCPYELVAQCLYELPLSDQLTCRVVCKQFYQLINDLEVRGQLVNCKVKDYVKTVETLMPRFIRQLFNVSEFTKITPLFISSKDSSDAHSISVQCRGKLVVGHLNDKEYFFTFPCQQFFRNDPLFLSPIFTTLAFYSVQNNDVWHFAAFEEGKGISDYFPLSPNIRTFRKSLRYLQYEMMLTEIFQMKEWRQFSRSTHEPSDFCVLKLIPNLLDQIAGSANQRKV